MDRRSKKIQFPLILVLALSITVFAAWVNSFDLSEADFLSSGTCFEISGPDTSLACTDFKTRSVGSGFDAVALFLDDHPLKSLFALNAQSSPIPSKTSILRC